MHSSPVTAETLGSAQQIGHHVEAGSACDWWKDPASFDANAAADRSHGFIIDKNELDPESGLFVHTVGEKDPAAMYFAVLPSTATASNVVPGENSLTTAKHSNQQRYTCAAADSTPWQPIGKYFIKTANL